LQQRSLQWCDGAAGVTGVQTSTPEQAEDNRIVRALLCKRFEQAQRGAEATALKELVDLIRLGWANPD
jgi:hypothetical protein